MFRVLAPGEPLDTPGGWPAVLAVLTVFPDTSGVFPLGALGHQSSPHQAIGENVQVKDFQPLPLEMPAMTLGQVPFLTAARSGPCAQRPLWSDLCSCFYLFVTKSYSPPEPWPWPSPSFNIYRAPSDSLSLRLKVWRQSHVECNVSPGQ